MSEDNRIDHCDCNCDEENQNTEGCCCGRNHEHGEGCCGDGHEHSEGGCCGGGHAHGEGGCCGGDHAHGEGGCCGRRHDAPSEDEFDYSELDVDLPKPTLIMSVTTLAQQAMVSMGILPHPGTGKSVFLMKQASYLIDSIDVLYEKTNGNRTEDETRTISSVMSELRMLYVKASEEKSRRDAAKKSK